jgi:hypothetical protein
VWPGSRRLCAKRKRLSVAARQKEDWPHPWLRRWPVSQARLSPPDSDPPAVAEGHLQPPVPGTDFYVEQGRTQAQARFPLFRQFASPLHYALQGIHEMERTDYIRPSTMAPSLGQTGSEQVYDAPFVGAFTSSVPSSYLGSTWDNSRRTYTHRDNADHKTSATLPRAWRVGRAGEHENMIPA